MMGNCPPIKAECGDSSDGWVGGLFGEYRFLTRYRNATARQAVTAVPYMRCGRCFDPKRWTGAVAVRYADLETCATVSEKPRYLRQEQGERQE